MKYRFVINMATKKSWEKNVMINKVNLRAINNNYNSNNQQQKREI